MTPSLALPRFFSNILIDTPYVKSQPWSYSEAWNYWRAHISSTNTRKTRKRRRAYKTSRRAADRVLYDGDQTLHHVEGLIARSANTEASRLPDTTNHALYNNHHLVAQNLQQHLYQLHTTILLQPRPAIPPCRHMNNLKMRHSHTMRRLR